MFYDADIFEGWETPPTGLTAFLIWLRLCWELLWAQDDTPLPAAPLPVMRNRRDIRNAMHDRRRTLPPVRNLAPYHLMGPKGVSPAQFLERRCRLSPLGRVWIYRLSRRRKVRRGGVKRALRRDPLLLAAGLCAAHEWPN